MSLDMVCDYPCDIINGIGTKIRGAAFVGRFDFFRCALKGVTRGKCRTVGPHQLHRHIAEPVKFKAEWSTN